MTMFGVCTGLAPGRRPTCRLVGQNGNIFNLMAIASRALREAGEFEAAEEMTQRILADAKSYDHALLILLEYVYEGETEE